MALRVQTVPEKPLWYVKHTVKCLTIGPLPDLEAATKAMTEIHRGEHDWLGNRSGFHTQPREGWHIECLTRFWTKVIEEPDPEPTREQKIALVQDTMNIPHEDAVRVVDRMRPRGSSSR